MKDKTQGYAHLTAKIDSLQEQLHLCNVDQLSTAAELAAAQAEIAALLKTKMTLAELGNMISMANTITFSRDMHRATPEAIQKELLACINEWLRGDDKATRIKREKNK